MRMLGSADQIVGVCREELAWSGDYTRLLQVANGDAQDFKARAESLREQVAVGDEVLVNPGADGAKACKAYANGLTHIEPGSIRPAGELPNENCEFSQRILD